MTSPSLPPRLTGPSRFLTPGWENLTTSVWTLGKKSAMVEEKHLSDVLEISFQFRTWTMSKKKRTKCCTQMVKWSRKCFGNENYFPSTVIGWSSSFTSGCRHLSPTMKTAGFIPMNRRHDTFPVRHQRSLSIRFINPCNDWNQMMSKLHEVASSSQIYLAGT